LIVLGFRVVIRGGDLGRLVEADAAPFSGALKRTVYADDYSYREGRTWVMGVP
jgi:hypothetical protein